VSITPIEISVFVLFALGAVHCVREMLLGVMVLDQK
jgi:hypothetical protein